MSFVAQITADISNFDKNIKKAVDIADSSTKKMQAQFNKLGDSFVKIGAKASILSTAIVGATVGLVKMGIDAGNASAEINNLSTATSLSTDVIQELSYVATASNSSFEGLQRSMDSFQRRLKTVGEEGSRVNEMFGRLGVSTTDASGNVRRMDDVLLDTFNRLGDMEDGLAKNAIGTELFGRSWNEVALIVSSGSKGIAELREEAHKLGLVLDKDTLQSSDDFATAMELVGFQIDKLKTKIGASLVPILQESLLPLLEDKIIPAVSRFADSIARLSEEFNALSPSTKNAIFAITGITAAIGPLLLSLGGLIKILPKILSLVKAGFKALTGPIGIAVAGATLIIANWDKIKIASNNVVKYIKDDWERLKESLAVTSSSIGKLMRADFNGWWDDVKKSFDLGIDYLKNRWQQLKNIFKDDKIGNPDQKLLDAALAANEMTGALGDNKKAVEDLIKPLGDLPEALDIFQSGTIAEAIRATSSEIKTLGQYLTDLQTGKIVVANVHDEIVKVEERLSVLNTALNTLTGDRELNIKVKTDSALDIFKDTDFGSDAGLVVPIIPQIDTSLLKDMMGDLSEGIRIITIDLASMLSSTLTDIFGAVSNAIMDGDSVIDALGASLLGTLGGIMVQLGQMVIATGEAIEAVKAALIGGGGIGAIAAGAALIAIGSMFSAGARKLGNSMGSGGGYSSAPSMQNSQPALGHSEYRGAYRDDFSVEFKIGSNELVGVLDTANQRRNRLG